MLKELEKHAHVVQKEKFIYLEHAGNPDWWSSI